MSFSSQIITPGPLSRHFGAPAIGRAFIVVRGTNPKQTSAHVVRDEEEYVVEKVLEERTVGSKAEYLVKWRIGRRGQHLGARQGDPQEVAFREYQPQSASKSSKAAPKKKKKNDSDDEAEAPRAQRRGLRRRRWSPRPSRGARGRRQARRARAGARDGRDGQAGGGRSSWMTTTRRSRRTRCSRSLPPG